MEISFKSNIIQTPKHDINEEVIFFNHVDGTIDKGIIIQIGVVKTNDYQTISYAIQLNNDNVLPQVSANLIFNDKDDAKDWIKHILNSI